MRFRMGTKVAIFRAGSAVSSFQIPSVTLFWEEIARMIPGASFSGGSVGLTLWARRS